MVQSQLPLPHGISFDFESGSGSKLSKMVLVASQGNEVLYDDPTTVGLQGYVVEILGKEIKE